MPGRRLCLAGALPVSFSDPAALRFVRGDGAADTKLEVIPFFVARAVVCILRIKAGKQLRFDGVVCELCDCFLESVTLVRNSVSSGTFLTAADSITYSRSPLIHNNTQQTIAASALTNSRAEVGIQYLFHYPPNCFRMADHTTKPSSDSDKTETICILAKTLIWKAPFHKA